MFEMTSCSVWVRWRFSAGQMFSFGSSLEVCQLSKLQTGVLNIFMQMTWAGLSRRTQHVLL